MAFGASKTARLVLKLTGRASELADLEQSLGDLSGLNVEIIKDYLSQSQLAALYRETDVLLSLHRAEGFGLPMLEAMAHGIPVVATGWSGNLEFMNASNSRLVPYDLIPVQDTAAVYGASVWADPDVAAAASALRELASDPGEYARLAAAAHRRANETGPSFPFAFNSGTSPLPLKATA